MFASFKEQSSQLSQQDQKTINFIFISLGVISQAFQAVISSSFGAIDDMQLYTDTLESYSVELDKTLTEIFEQAKKYAVNRTKEQQELMKKSDAP